MSGEASLINAAGDSVGRKVPVLGISIGAAETAKEEWDAKNAFGRAAHRNGSKQERIAANRAATIYSRRAILKAASTVAGQIPGYGTAAALALDGVNAVLNRVPQGGRGRDQFHVRVMGQADRQRFLSLVGGANEIADVETAAGDNSRVRRNNFRVIHKHLSPRHTRLCQANFGLGVEHVCLCGCDAGTRGNHL